MVGGLNQTLDLLRSQALDKSVVLTETTGIDYCHTTAGKLDQTQYDTILGTVKLKIWIMNMYHVYILCNMYRVL